MKTLKQSFKKTISVCTKNFVIQNSQGMGVAGLSNVPANQVGHQFMAQEIRAPSELPWNASLLQVGKRMKKPWKMSQNHAG